MNRIRLIWSVALALGLGPALAFAHENGEFVPPDAETVATAHKAAEFVSPDAPGAPPTLPTAVGQGGTAHGPDAGHRSSSAAAGANEALSPPPPEPVSARRFTAGS